MKNSLLTAALAGVLLVAGGSVSYAQATYPDRAITLVVPYPPGGSNDRFARLLANGLGKDLNVPVVVDNRAGASGVIGTVQVAKSQPDGYTLLLVASSLTTNEAVKSRADFHPVRDLTPIAMVAKGPFIVAVNNDFPVKTPKEFIDLIKANPGKFNYASSGTGGTNQFATELLNLQANLKTVHVPYKGLGQATTDLIAGQTQYLIASGPSLLPHIRSGNLRAIGVTSLTESATAPGLVPMATVVPGYEFELWWGVFGPAGLPEKIQTLLNKKINEVINQPEMQATFLADGAQAMPMSVQDFTQLVASDVERWTDLAKRQNITAN